MAGRVSVVIPVFNKRDSLPRAIASALAQKPRPAEIIVVDDGSTDGSLDAIRPFAAEVRPYSQRNSGAAAARNLGMAKATGEYLAFLDADDYWLDDFLAETSRFLDLHPDCGAVSTAYYASEGSATVVVPLGSTGALPPLGTGVVENFFETYSIHRHVCTDTVLLRRSLIDVAGPMRADLLVSEDIEYWMRLATKTTWGFVARPLAVYDRGVPDSLTRISVRDRLMPTIEEWQRDILPGLGPRDLPGFERFRSALALRTALNMLAQGRPADARSTARSGYIDKTTPIGLGLNLLRSAPTLIWRAAGHVVVAGIALKAMVRRLKRRHGAA